MMGIAKSRTAGEHQRGCERFGPECTGLQTRASALEGHEKHLCCLQGRKEKQSNFGVKI